MGNDEGNDEELMTCYAAGGRIKVREEEDKVSGTH